MMPTTRSQVRSDRDFEGSSSQESQESTLFGEIFGEVVVEEILAREEVAMVVQQRSRFQYKTFHGKPKEDPNEWIEDFAGTTKANGEDTIKLTTLAGVMRGEARPWYNSLPQATKTDCEAFKIAFVMEFCKVGEESEALIRIGQMWMKEK